MTQARKILIVEDEPIVQLHLQRLVTQAGHHVSGTASTAAQALEAAERESPELVLMDIRLPGDVDGIDAARMLCDRHNCGVVFASAYADSKTVERTMDIGAAGYIVKPFTDAEVRAAIGTAVAGRARVQQARERERSLSSLLAEQGRGVLMTDARGMISFADPKACHLVGWEPGEACGKDLLDVVRLVSDADAVDLRAAMARCFAEGRPDSLSQIQIVRRDGSRGIVELALDPVLSEAQGTSGLVVALRDPSAPAEPRAAVMPSADTRFGAGTRMVVYSHDTFGLGHLQRCRHLIRLLLERNPGLSVLLVTGSPVVHRYELPVGADYVKLPTVRKVGAERYEARSLVMSGPDIRTLRSNLMLRTVRDYKPNVLLVDHAPLGMNEEVRPTLEWLRRTGGCTTILGLRDIIDRPNAVIELWKERGIYEALRDLYDHVLVYGAQAIYDPVRLYEFPAEIAAKTHFMHYVSERGGPEADNAGADSLVAVSIGGGDGGADIVIGSFLEMLHRHRDDAALRGEIVTGPLVSPETQRRIREQAEGLPVVVREFVESTSALFARADLVIATGGYNTVTQLLAHARRAIVIPRILHRDEQLIRARRMAELGLLTCLHPDEVDPDCLFEAIRRSLATPEEPLAQGRATGVVPLDGAERVAAFCEGLMVTSSAQVGQDE